MINWWLPEDITRNSFVDLRSVCACVYAFFLFPSPTYESQGCIFIEVGRLVCSCGTPDEMHLNYALFHLELLLEFARMLRMVSCLSNIQPLLDVLAPWAVTRCAKLSESQRSITVSRISMHIGI